MLESRPVVPHGHDTIRHYTSIFLILKLIVYIFIISIHYVTQLNFSCIDHVGAFKPFYIAGYGFNPSLFSHFLLIYEIYSNGPQCLVGQPNTVSRPSEVLGPARHDPISKSGLAGHARDELSSRPVRPSICIAY